MDSSITAGSNGYKVVEPIWFSQNALLPEALTPPQAAGGRGPQRPGKQGILEDWSRINNK